MQLSQFQRQKQQINPAMQTLCVKPSDYVLHLQKLTSPDSQYLVTQKGGDIYESAKYKCFDLHNASIPV